MPFDELDRVFVEIAPFIGRTDIWTALPDHVVVTIHRLCADGTAGKWWNEASINNIRQRAEVEITARNLKGPNT
jgi:hypothetical protein